MHILGKIIGGILGYIIGGLYGLVMGVLLGHCYDAGLFSHLSNTHNGETQDVFFRAVFLVMGKLAKADGVITHGEIELAQQIMHHLHLDSGAQEQAINYFNLGRQPNFNWDEILGELKQACHKKPELLHLFIDIQLQIAFADQQPHKNEKLLLQDLCQKLGFSPNEFYQLRDDTSSPHQEPITPTPTPLDLSYQTLKISPDVNNIELKRAYRRLINQYHPDKLVSKGLPEELLQLATEKTQEVRTAYEQICKSRGIEC